MRFWTTALVFVGLAQSAWAVQLKVTPSQLCAISDWVVLAEVTSTETRWSANAEGGIERVAWLSVERTVRGQHTTNLEVVMPGGTMGDITHWVEDVPDLGVDKRYMLFLKQTEAGIQVIGGDQGAVAVTTPTSEKKAIRSVGTCQR